MAQFYIRELSGSTARVTLEQDPGPQAAMVAIDNGSGEVKAMVGGYSFEDSKFNRATQAQRQVGSSFKVYVYAAALEKGFTPFDTILDAPFTVMSGGQPYSPHNYDEKYEGMITLRRAFAGSRNVPAVKLADKIGINDVIDVARRFGITSPLPPYLPITLGAADLNLMEHVSAFTVFPDDGIRIDAHLIRRVTTYDGALLEEAHPPVHDVISPEVARTMVAMLEDVVNFGTGVGAKALGRPSAGKTGTTNDFTDAWYMGFTPQLTAGVWVGFDDKQKSLGRSETGARAALPIWLEFMQNALGGHAGGELPQCRAAREDRAHQSRACGYARQLRQRRDRKRATATKERRRNPPSTPQPAAAPQPQPSSKPAGPAVHRRTRATGSSRPIVSVLQAEPVSHSDGEWPSSARTASAISSRCPVKK